MEDNNTISGSVKETPRNAIRMGRQKDIIAERKEDHMSKEVGVRARSYYDDPDYETIAEFSDRQSNLTAPQYPGYEQRWINKNKDNGSHLKRMLDIGGWKLRDPKTVPNTAGLNTQKWGEYDAIVAGNELVLCCMRKDFFEQRQRKQFEEQERRTHDTSSLGRDLYGASASAKSNHVRVFNPEFSRQ